jgi:hypothetical protein
MLRSKLHFGTVRYACHFFINDHLAGFVYINLCGVVPSSLNICDMLRNSVSLLKCIIMMDQHSYCCRKKIYSTQQAEGKRCSNGMMAMHRFITALLRDLITLTRHILIRFARYSGLASQGLELPILVMRIWQCIEYVHQHAQKADTQA